MQPLNRPPVSLMCDSVNRTDVCQDPGLKCLMGNAKLYSSREEKLRSVDLFRHFLLHARRVATIGVTYHKRLVHWFSVHNVLEIPKQRRK